MSDEISATVDEAEDERREELDDEVRARRAAALGQVRQWGDPVLGAVARPVESFDGALRDQARQMGAIMNDALGVGLAATQLGILNRVLVYRAHPDAEIAALVNPELEWQGDERESAEEGCLSIQGVAVDVERAVNVRVRARDECGAPLLIEASGLEARVLQHEIDHLDGVLILQRTSRAERKEALRTLRDAQRAA